VMVGSPLPSTLCATVVPVPSKNVNSPCCVSRGPYVPADPALILVLVSLSMVISGMGPYSVVRLITLQDIFGIGGFTLLITLLNTLALLYWCNPKHRKSIRL